MPLPTERLAAATAAVEAQIARVSTLSEAASLPATAAADVAQLHSTIDNEFSAARLLQDEVSYLTNLLPELSRRNADLRAEAGRLKGQLRQKLAPPRSLPDWRARLSAVGGLRLQNHHLARPLPLSTTKPEARTNAIKRVAMVWGVSETTRHMVRGLLRARGGWSFTRDARGPDVALQWAPLAEIVWDREYTAGLAVWWLCAPTPAYMPPAAPG